MLHVGREGGNLGEREGGLTFHMMVNWVELFDIKFVMEGAIGPMVIEGLLIKLCYTNGRGLTQRGSSHGNICRVTDQTNSIGHDDMYGVV